MDYSEAGLEQSYLVFFITNPTKKVNINESVVRGFAEEIRQNGFLDSQLEIDDEWENCYGEAQFNADKFPDVAGLVNDLKEQVRRRTNCYTCGERTLRSVTNRVSGQRFGFTPS